MGARRAPAGPLRRLILVGLGCRLTGCLSIDYDKVVYQPANLTDIVMPVHGMNCVVEYAISGLNWHYGPRRIVVVTNPRHCGRLAALGDNIACLDENLVLPGVSLESIAKKIAQLSRGADPSREVGYGGHTAAGWYLQQFVKLGIVQTPLLLGEKKLDKPISHSYIVWDSDMILLKRLEPFTEDGRMRLMAAGRPKLASDSSYNGAFRRLTGLDLKLSSIRGTGNLNKGYVAHHMVMHKPFVKEMLAQFEDPSAKKLQESPQWPWKVLEAACGHGASWYNCTHGFSEYYSMASWVRHKHRTSMVDVPEALVRFHPPEEEALARQPEEARRKKKICCPSAQLLEGFNSKDVVLVGFEQAGCA